MYSFLQPSMMLPKTTRTVGVALGPKATMIYLDLDANEREWDTTVEMLADVSQRILEASARSTKDHEDPDLPGLRSFARLVGAQRHKLNVQRLKLWKELDALKEVT